ncbi:helix-turn-helix transcriptional regulator [Staphylococcus agnetis]|uniref:helix-turn-helix transcriptional regulator n=1 Tax=Staphylococcus agnetis TaxID=985762 RepID=UPI0004E3D77A|nr:helix-turn-helix transcriptional regulator [Staphylococcus agnetis]KFE41948.1 DNA-binding protein [Staphylococcus agnetis]MBY7663994.1 helix-turn-helix transcriptional regulator [Staphylococcus agnetis]NJH66038.1 helix-turn-helix domain-containing protein [Staphylococcus agnetis]NJH98082.1 helix-turn-helix domain-containing protein [Staphylococcus agnetis]PTH45896.1 XRE family transcriptional regulator [Staphylococcus agnetis]
MFKVYVKRNDLKKAMFIKGLNLSTLAIKAEVSSTYLSQIINGKKTPSPKLAKKIADALDVEIEDVFEI